MKYRVSYLMPPKSVLDAVYERPNDSLAKAYYDASFGMGKSAVDFSAHVAWAAANGLYERVVNLDAPDLEAVFSMCNSKDCHWADALPDSANAVFLKKDGLRSMSVGDLVDDGAGNHRAVASFGFIPISL
jgi:hypothetical protein